MSDYWYTAEDGRKVHVLDGETPLEAYQRMYPQDKFQVEEFDNEPITLEEYDEIKNAGGLDAQKKQSNSEDEHKRMRNYIETIMTNRINEIVNNPKEHFTKSQLRKIHNYAVNSFMSEEAFIKKVAFKIVVNRLSPDQAIRETYNA